MGCNAAMSPSFANKRLAKDGRMKRYFYYRCITTTKENWNACTVNQVNADRLENYVLENLQRISLDKQYLKGLKLQTDAQNRLGKLASCSDFDPDRLSNDLKSFLEGLERKKGAGKNLWAKQFIKSIIYSIEPIQINFSVFENLPPAEKKYPGEKISGILKNKSASSPEKTRNELQNLK